MRGRFALRSELLARADDARAENLFPKTIRDDARGERIPRIDDRLCQFETTASLGEWLALGAGQHLQELSRDLPAGTIWISANEHG